MANTLVPFLLSIFFVCFSIQGNCQCDISKFKIDQKATGESVEGKTKWLVNVTNDCPCDRFDIDFDCFEFNTTLAFDPKVISYRDAICSFQGYLQPFESFTFPYAWDPPYHFQVVEAFYQCT
ncbi:hypothetical protein M5689_000349 [Euphorbia peplus]|nr:hypothetical protein M5689_000349 [Euphorbia peplus]